MSDKPTPATKSKLFHHEEHEAHEACLLKQSPLRGLRELRDEDIGLRATPALERGAMKRQLRVTTHARQKEEDQAYWRKQTGETRLDMVEMLRVEAGTFLYEYPARLRRVVTVTRKA